MKASAENGCEGCEFFARFISNHAELRDQFGEEMPRELQARLSRLYDTCGIDLEFWSDNHGLISRTSLRICTTFGMWLSRWHLYSILRWLNLLISTRGTGREPTESTEMKCNYGTQIREYEDEISLGRPIVDNSSDEECLNIASMWLARCTQYHGTECRKLQDVKLPTRLLHLPRSDAEIIRLKETVKQSGQYVALSHCWGKNGIDAETKTTSKTIDDKMRGFLASSLPQSFQDAIYIARRFGFEYIWIDALCIIQDDRDDWSREASQMAEVYCNASLTISADRARDSKHGIFGQRFTHRSPCFDQHGEWFLQVIGGGWATIDSMPLSQRGWTLQERFLSPRTIHYVEEQMAWDCRTGIFIEEHRSCVVPRGHFSQWMFHVRTEQFNMGHGGDGPETLHQNVKKDIPGELMNTNFRVHSWNECVRE